MSTVKLAENGAVQFMCPGCKEGHTIHVGEGRGPRWGFNGSTEKPTFTPSVLVRAGHYLPGWHPPKVCWCSYRAARGASPCECKRCHSFVTDGRIQFLSDCTHELANQTVDLPEFPV